MAIVGVRSATKSINTLPHIGTDLVIWQNNGTRSGESNSFNSGSFNSGLGRALNFAGNRSATRVQRMCKINRKAPIGP